jgi:hypothetical protein
MKYGSAAIRGIAISCATPELEIAQKFHSDKVMR